MEQAREQVIEKIRKLLALATSDNENEAAAAAAKAHEILEAHNLSMFEVEDVHAPSPVIEDRSLTVADSTWLSAIVTATARSNYCAIIQRRTVVGRTRRRNYSLIGRPENVMVAKEVIGWLEGRLLKLATESWDKGITLQRHKTAFLLGASYAVARRLSATTDSEPADSRALVVRLDLENDAYKATAYPSLKMARSRAPRVDPISYNAGHRAGSAVSLSPIREVGGGARGQLPVAR